MDCTSGNRISDRVAEINITGNVIPPTWFKTIVNDKGRPYLLAIMILSEIVYWYRPVEVRDEDTGEFIGYRTKFKHDLLQKSYKDLAEYYQVSKRQVTDAIIVLENLGVIKRDFRTIMKNGVSFNNVLFIRLNPDRLRDLTYPHNNDGAAENQIEKDSENISDSSQGSSPISEKNVDNVDKCTTLSRNFGIGSPEKTRQALPKFRETNTEITNHRLYLYNSISSNHLPRDECIDLFAEQISYDAIRCDYADNQCALDVLDLCVEIAGGVISSDKKTFQVNGECLPKKDIVNKLTQMNITHMHYVIDSFLSSNTKVKKIHTYLLTCMFNSIASMGANIANHLAANGYLDKRGT